MIHSNANKQTKQTQKVSDKIVVDSKDDYKMVTVLPLEKTIGLKQTGTFTGVSTKTKGEPPIANEKQTAMRIKSKSASNGSPFVSITETHGSVDPINETVSSSAASITELKLISSDGEKVVFSFKINAKTLVYQINYNNKENYMIRVE